MQRGLTLRARAGLQGYATTLIVPGAAMALIILGGIGFPVFAECAARWKNRTFRLSAYAKLVVGMTAGLVFGGALLLLLSDWNGALRDYPVWAKVWNALFMSVTTRTAGYDTVAPGTFSGLGQAVMVVLMLIGASPASTGGGVKTTTFGVLAVAVWSELHGPRRLDLHGAQHLAVDGAARALGRRRLPYDDARGHGAADLHGEDALFGAHLRGRLRACHDGALRRHHAGALHARQAHHNDADVLGTRRPLHIPLHSHSSRRRLRDTLPETHVPIG
ncbi:potassium transporter TrkG [uncultured Cloacibacillus sp.]|uniref:potassium transporter TrkG n=1 Tax=uncultured Cloacibacillus sp. TaxID=889794 RepID=UPI00320BB44C